MAEIQNFWGQDERQKRGKGRRRKGNGRVELVGV